MKKRLQEYGWLEHYSRARIGIIVDGIDYRVPRKRLNKCDGCAFLRRLPGILESFKAYFCLVEADLRPKEGGIGVRPAGLCFPCQEYSKTKVGRRSGELEKIIRDNCKEEDDVEQEYLDLESDPGFVG